MARTARCCVANAFFHQTEANLAEIQPQNHQNVKKTQIWQKVPGVNGLFYLTINIIEFSGENVISNAQNVESVNFNKAQKWSFALSISFEYILGYVRLQINVIEQLILQSNFRWIKS